MKGRYKLWGFIGLVLLIFSVFYGVEKGVLNGEIVKIVLIDYILFYVGIVLLAAFLCLQLGAVILIFGTEWYGERGDLRSIYDLDSKEIPDHRIGYLQIPVMIVKLVKIINNWADRKL